MTIINKSRNYFDQHWSNLTICDPLLTIFQLTFGHFLPKSTKVNNFSQNQPKLNVLDPNWPKSTLFRPIFNKFLSNFH
jgi:hypothetical protein